MLRATRRALFSLQCKDGTSYDIDKLADKKYFLIYFGAGWCDRCRIFTPQLITFYDKHKDSKKFEVLFATWDKDAASFTKNYQEDHGDWPAFYHSERRTIERMQTEFEVFSVPVVVVVTPSGVVMTKLGCEMITKDPEALEFPWRGVEGKEAAAQRLSTMWQVGLIVVGALGIAFATVPRQGKGAYKNLPM
jgi:nucleoredoxin